MTLAALALAALIGYGFGCIPFANLIARRHGVEDLRDVGDRNPGYWNARRKLGSRNALPLLLLDAAKGAAAVGVGFGIGALVAEPTTGLLAGVDLAVCGGIAGWAGVVVGHMFPATMRFRGGRSLLCFAGGAIVLVPWAALIGAVVLLLVRWRFGFARGIQACLVVGPFAIWCFYGAGLRLFAAVLLLLVIGVRAAIADRALRRAGIDKHQPDVA